MTTAPKRPDLDALRKEAAEALTDPKERAQALRDLDALEKMTAESERRDAALARTVQAHKAATRRWLVAILVLCTLVAVAAGIWLPYAPAVGIVVACAFFAVFAFIALARSPNLPSRRAATTSADLASIPVDPLAEAEVYVAYGRVEQAMKVLQEGLAREPQRKDLAAKLAELRKR